MQAHCEVDLTRDDPLEVMSCMGITLNSDCKDKRYNAIFVCTAFDSRFALQILCSALF